MASSLVTPKEELRGQRFESDNCIQTIPMRREKASAKLTTFALSTYIGQIKENHAERSFDHNV